MLKGEVGVWRDPQLGHTQGWVGGGVCPSLEHGLAKMHQCLGHAEDR